MSETQRIRIYGDPCLKEQCRPVEDFGPGLRELVERMAETMYEARGIGLAAPQVGEELRLYLTDVTWPETEEDGRPVHKSYRVFINPELVWESDEDEPFTEGCLSLPGVEAEVFRPSRIRLRYQDLEGRHHEEDLDGIQARCCLHEGDHLDGVLFVDRLPFAQRSRVAGRLAELKRGNVPA